MVFTGTGTPTTTLPIQNGWPRASFDLCIIMPILAALAVAGRFYARRMTRVHLGIDDWLILVALPLYMVEAIIAALSLTYGGMGHHKEELAPGRIVYTLKLLLAVQYFYCSSIALTKASVCFFLLRIFGRKRWFRYVSYTIIVTCACFMLFNILTASLTCRPIAANWNKSIPGAHCASEEAMFLAVGIFDVVIDAAILTLPIPVIFSLQMSMRDKLSIMALFAFGTFDTTAGIMRIVANNKIDFKGDWTYTTGELWFWSVLEPGLAICVVCLLVMRPLLDKILFHRRSVDTTMKTETRRSTGYYTGDYLDRARLCNSTVRTSTGPFGLQFDEISHDDDPSPSSSRVENHLPTRTGNDILVSREVHITTVG